MVDAINIKKAILQRYCHNPLKSRIKEKNFQNFVTKMLILTSIYMSAICSGNK